MVPFQNVQEKLPSYIQYRIIKYCWFDEYSSFKWRISLNLISKRHFHFISHLFTNLNEKLLLYPLISSHLENPFCVFKNPLELNISIQDLNRFVSTTKNNTQDLVTLTHSLKSLNISSIQELSNQSLDNLSTIIENDKDLYKLKFKFNNNQDLSLQNLFNSLLNRPHFKNLSLKIENGITKEQLMLLNQFLQVFHIKYGRDLDLGIEKLKLVGSIEMDHIHLDICKHLKSLSLKRVSISNPTQFFQELLKCRNLTSLEINYIDIKNQDSDQYQELFNENLKKYLMNSNNKLSSLHTPFAAVPDIMKTITHQKNLVNISVIPTSMPSSPFLKPKPKGFGSIHWKMGYPLSVLQQFCQNATKIDISKLTIDHIDDAKSEFIQFLKSNSSISTLELNRSMGQDLLDIMESLIDNKNISSLSIHSTENTPTLDNMNQILALANKNKSITSIKAKLFYFFSGLQLENLDTGDFNIVYFNQDEKLIYLSRDLSDNRFFYSSPTCRGNNIKNSPLFQKPIISFLAMNPDDI
ncbi:hypothetical protein CYY_002710 [Polysphondylium violaceum]|uniref:Uncharacterized protein n=1 Tax=Polysphondylium violaceum TaxID=133409 RepID=A0A8J4V216_9MYCE|nr:hypothetical protein CYY_002710 [Polysphondylium violaceum]